MIKNIKEIKNKSLKDKLQYIANDPFRHRVHDQPTLKLNKNKKYMLQQERCTEIQRQNRFLFQKLAKIRQRGLQQRPPAVKKRKKSKKNDDSIKKHHSHSKDQAQILFKGMAQIDEVNFKIKITLDKKDGYKLIAKNEHTVLFLEIPYKQYLSLHQNQLQGNPYNIIQYLEITKQGVQIRMTKSRDKKKKSKKSINFLSRQSREQHKIISRQQTRRRRNQFLSLQKLEKEDNIRISRTRDYEKQHIRHSKHNNHDEIKFPSIQAKPRFKTAWKQKQYQQESSFYH